MGNRMSGKNDVTPHKIVPGEDDHHPQPEDDHSETGLFDPKIPLVAVCGLYSFVHIFRMDTGEKIASVEIGTTGDIQGFGMIEMMHSGRRVLALGTDDGDIRFVDLKTRRILDGTTIEGHLMSVNVLVDLPPELGDDLIASASSDHTIRVWKKTEKTQLLEFHGHGHWVYGLCCVPSKKWVISGSHDNTIRVWDVAGQRGVADGVLKSHTDYVHAVMFGGAQYPQILSASHDKTIKMFSLDGFECVRTFSGGSWSRSLLMHPEEDHLFFSGHFRNVCLWDIRKESQPVKKRKLHASGIPRMVSAGSNLFVSCSVDNSVKVWSGDTLEEFASGDGGKLKMTTEDWNWGVVCLVPFSSTIPSAPPLPEE